MKKFLNDNLEDLKALVAIQHHIDVKVEDNTITSYAAPAGELNVEVKSGTESIVCFEMGIDEEDDIMIRCKESGYELTLVGNKLENSAWVDETSDKDAWEELVEESMRLLIANADLTPLTAMTVEDKKAAKLAKMNKIKESFKKK